MTTHDRGEQVIHIPREELSKNPFDYVSHPPTLGSQDRGEGGKVSAGVTFAEHDRIVAELTARVQALEAETTHWRADATGHLFRCARINGKWSCAAGCAIARAEAAEAQVKELQREVARLTAGIKEAHDLVARPCQDDRHDHFGCLIDGILNLKHGDTSNTGEI